MFGLSPAQMLILLVVVLVVFGTKKLRNAGADLGAAVKGFKKAMQEDEPKSQDAQFKAIDETAAKAETQNTKEKEQA